LGTLLNQTLIIFSGLPGTGKTTLARMLARDLGIPIFRIDDFVDFLPRKMLDTANPFWDELISTMLLFVESQLDLGLSVIVDSVFMGPDRTKAMELAATYGAAYRPIFTYMTDEVEWKNRIDERFEISDPEEGVADWSQITEQRKDFIPWNREAALFVDGCNSVVENYRRILEYIESGETID
jgi:predicted kinase